MFIGTNAIEFAKAFPDNESCYRLLNSIKWRNGYKCRECGCQDHIKGRTAFHYRCRKCGYDESPTSNTLFHDMRMPILKAFFMIFRIATKIKGMSTAELGAEVGVQQRTAWLLKRKIQVAIQKSRGRTSFMEVMVFIVHKRADEEHKKKRQAGLSKKNRSLLTQSDKQGAGSGLPFAIGQNTDGKAKSIAFINFLGRTKTDWRYPGTAVEQLHFNNWIAGIHHRCAAALFPVYCDEFAYRFKRRKKRKTIFNQLLEEMMNVGPHPYFVLKIARA